MSLRAFVAKQSQVQELETYKQELLMKRGDCSVEKIAILAMTLSLN
jgi:hypothetical protein